MRRLMPLLLTALLFLIVLLLQFIFLLTNASTGVLIFGAILVAIGAASVIIQINLLAKQKR